MKLLLSAITLGMLVGCSVSVTSEKNDKNGDDCFTLRDDEYCKVEKNG